MACVQPYAINPLNFLRWRPTAFTTVPFDVPLRVCDPGGAACLGDEDSTLDAEFPKLPAVSGDEFHFFINSEVGVDITAGIASVGIGWVQNGKFVNTIAGNLSHLADPQSATRFFLYGTLFIDCLDDGVYWPVIYDVNDLHVLLIGNPVEVINKQDWRNTTVWVKYRHPFSLFGVNFTALPDFYQEFRLDLSMYQPTQPFDEETYTDRNNYTRRTRLGISQVYTLQTDFWDADKLRAGSLMLAHGELYIDDTLVKAQGGLEPDYPDGGQPSGWVTAKGKVIDLNFARTVLSC